MSAHGGMKSEKGQAAYYRMQWEAALGALADCLTEHRELREAIDALAEKWEQRYGDDSLAQEIAELRALNRLTP